MIIYLTRLQLQCALEEWESGVYAAVTFETAVYRDLYNSIADLNFPSIIGNPYLHGKLETLWARIYERGW